MFKKWLRKRRYNKICKETLWNLDYDFANYIYPRLKAFKKASSGSYPYCSGSSKGWEEILDKMIEAFKLLSEGTWEIDLTNKDKQRIISEGLELFSKHFLNLWY